MPDAVISTDAGARRERTGRGAPPLLRPHADSAALLPCPPRQHGPMFGGVEVAGNVVILPDGQPRAVLRVDPINFDCRTAEEQDALAEQFAALAASLQPGQLLQIVVESRPLEAAAVVPRLCRGLRPQTPLEHAFADAWRPWMSEQMARAHVPDQYFYLVVAPPPPRPTLFGAGKERDQAATLRALEHATADIIRQLKEMQIGVTRLSREAILPVLWDAFHPRDDERCPAPSYFDPHPQHSAPTPAPAEPPRPARPGGRLRGTLRRKGHSMDETPPDREVAALWCQRRLTEVAATERVEQLQIGSMLARSLFLLEPPEVTNPGWLDRLVSLDCPYRLSLVLEGLEKKAERRRLKRRHATLNIITMAATVEGGVADVDMESAQAEARQQALETLDPGRTILRLGLYLTIFAATPEELADRTERALSVLTTQLGAEAGRGTGHQLPLWQSTLPLALDAARRRYRVRSETAGNALPFLTHNPGMTGGFPLGFSQHGHELVLLDLADASLNNLLINVVGKTGSGKTFVAQKLCLHVLLEGGRVIVVDKAGHYETLLAACGGTAVRLGSDDPPAINLWDGQPTAEKIAFVVNAHEVLLAQEPGQRLDRLSRAILSEGVRAVYEQAAGRQVLERDLVAWLRATAATSEGSERDQRRDLATKLSAYVGEGEHAALLDRPTTVNLDARLLVFDLDGLAGTMEPLAMFIIADAVRRRARAHRRKPGEGIKELLVVDEGWYLIRYAAAAAWIETLARKGRHWGLGIVFITQQLSDLIKDPVASSMFNAASIQLLFRQRDAQSEGESPIAWLREKLTLSAEEARTLYRLASVPGEYAEALLVRETKDSAQPRRGVVQIFCSPYERWLFTSDPMRDVPKRQQMIEAYGGNLVDAMAALVRGDEVPEVLADSDEPRTPAQPRPAHDTPPVAETAPSAASMRDASQAGDGHGHAHVPTAAPSAGEKVATRPATTGGRRVGRRRRTQPDGSAGTGAMARQSASRDEADRRPAPAASREINHEQDMVDERAS